LKGFKVLKNKILLLNELKVKTSSKF